MRKSFSCRVLFNYEVSINLILAISLENERGLSLIRLITYAKLRVKQGRLDLWEDDAGRGDLRDRGSSWLEGRGTGAVRRPVRRRPPGPRPQGCWGPWTARPSGWGQVGEARTRCRKEICPIGVLWKRGKEFWLTFFLFIESKICWAECPCLKVTSL
jgi:hypothetical protein